MGALSALSWRTLSPWAATLSYRAAAESLPPDALGAAGASAAALVDSDEGGTTPGFQSVPVAAL